jgi:hypothetical protein
VTVILGPLSERHVEHIFGIIHGSQPLARIPFPSDPAIKESYEPALPSSGIVLLRIIPSVINGMKSRKQSLTPIVLVHPTMEPFSVAPRSITLALQLPHLRMHVTPLQTSREAKSAIPRNFPSSRTTTNNGMVGTVLTMLKLLEPKALRT